MSLRTIGYVDGKAIKVDEGPAAAHVAGQRRLHDGGIYGTLAVGVSGTSEVGLRGTNGVDIACTRSKDCARNEGHIDRCRTRAEMDDDNEKRRKRRAA